MEAAVRKVRDLILYADEPFVPWELVHLKPPNGPRQEKPRFLAQGGLVRWQPGSFPPREMHVRAGQARSLVPGVPRPAVRADRTGPRASSSWSDRFGATKVTATPTGVRTLLRSGEFDLLHFSGHGAADPDDILDAKLLLQGLKRGGTVEPQYLGATTVSENASLGREGRARPGRRAQRLPGRAGRRAAHHGRRLRQGVPRRRRLGLRLLPVVGARAAVARLRGEALRRAAGRHADRRRQRPGP